MAATISSFGITATVDGYEWSCPVKALEHILNSLLDEGGPSGSDPNPDHTAAIEALDFLGTGELVSYDEMPYVAERVY